MVFCFENILFSILYNSANHASDTSFIDEFMSHSAGLLNITLASLASCP